MSLTRRLVLSVVCGLLVAPLGWAQSQAKNVILFVGDAAGIPTLHAASIYGYDKPGALYLYQMPHLALMETSSASSWVTDSAAGMTAIVTGRKTHNGVLSQSETAVRGSKDGEPLKTILEYAEERGLSTGLISNSSIVSATPAACYAHVNDRKKVGDIARRLLEPRYGDGVDVVIGPGREAALQAARNDGWDFVATARARGYRWVESPDDIPTGASRILALLDTDEFDLGRAVERAIAILSRNPRGYFLMVESDLHTENIVQGLERTVAFDRVIASTAQRVSEADTLIIFAADHSYDLRVYSGRKGRPLVSDNEKTARVDDQQAVRWSNLRRDDDHTGEEVLVAARGPGAQRVRGFLLNTDLFHIMLAAYGWK